MSQLFAWGGQSTGVSALASVLPKNTQGWSPSEWTGWISLQSKGLSSLFQHHSSKASILRRLAFFTVQLSDPYMTTGKTIAWTRRTFVGKVMSLLFHMLSRLAFLPRSKCPHDSFLEEPSLQRSNSISLYSCLLFHMMNEWISQERISFQEKYRMRQGIFLQDHSFFGIFSSVEPLLLTLHDFDNSA